MARYRAGSPEERRSKWRKQRVPGEVMRRKLSYPTEEGYVMRWRNDKDDRIQSLLDRGWEHVQKTDGVTPGDPDVSNETGQDLGTVVSKVVGAEDDGRPIKSYLLKIKKEWYEEDRKEKDEYLDALEKQIMDGGSVGGKDVDKKYVPRSGGTKIERG